MAKSKNLTFLQGMTAIREWYENNQQAFIMNGNGLEPVDVLHIDNGLAIVHTKAGKYEFINQEEVLIEAKSKTK